LNIEVALFREEFKKPNIIEIQNIVLGIGPVPVKDDLYLFRMLRITTFNVIIYLGERKNPQF